MSKFSKIKAGYVVALATVAAGAQAAIPAEVTAMATDAGALVVALTSVAVIIYAGMYMKRKFFG